MVERWLRRDVGLRNDVQIKQRIEFRSSYGNTRNAEQLSNERVTKAFSLCWRMFNQTPQLGDGSPTKFIGSAMPQFHIQNVKSVRVN